MTLQFIGRVSQRTDYGGETFTNLIEKDSPYQSHELGKDIHKFLEEFDGKQVKITIEVV